MIQSETEKFFEGVAKAALDRTGVPHEDAGYYTDSQRKLLMFIAEGYHLWRIEAKQERGRWSYTFMFSKSAKGRRVTLTKEEIDGLKMRHVLLFTDTGLAALDEDCHVSLEEDLEYEDNRGNNKG